MELKPSKNAGNKTSPAQRRINRANSLAALSTVLQVNFSEGARLIALGYESAEYAPVGEFAQSDIRAWVRQVRTQLGGVFRYVRATEWGREDCPATVHRIVVAYPEAAAGVLAASWPHGPAWVEDITPRELPALAGRIAADAAATNRRTWIASRGLKRSRQ